LRAANLGLHVVKEIAEKKIEEKLRLELPPSISAPAKGSGTREEFASMPILERLAPVDVTTSYERLYSVRSRLQDALDDLGRD
jgi:hypothetical protein